MKKKQIFKFFGLLPLFIFFMLNSWSQTKSVSGKVEDESGKPLPGVSIIVKGASVGTTTDASGIFKIVVPNLGKTLLVSYVEFVSQEIEISNQSYFLIRLTPINGKLGDVIVVGYGKQRKTDVTGAISSIRETDFKNQPITEVSQVLKGRSAGVAVQQSSGMPGGDFRIRIRGANSMLGNNDPLYVVDGVQMLAIQINDLNPNDITGVEILKDASASAIYGSRGSNGVVLITTKNGTRGKPKVEVHSFLSFKKSTDYYKPTGVNDYIGAANYIFPGRFSAADSANLVAEGVTDWQKLLTQQGLLQSHQVSVSGGSESTKYYFSINYTDEKGVLIKTTRKKYVFRGNIESKINDKLTVGFGMTGSQVNGHNLSASNENIYAAITMSPFTKPRNTDGTYLLQDQINFTFGNPYMKLNEENFDNSSLYGVINANLNYKVAKGLIFNSIFGLNVNRSEDAFFINEILSPSGAVAGRSYFGSNYWQTSNTFTYEKSFNDIHKFSVMAGIEASNSVFKSFAAENSQLQTQSGGYNNLGIGLAPEVRSSYDEGGALMSYLGRATYSLKDRYLLTATLRRDGTAKFRGDNKWAMFPSIALGWKLSEEKFIKKLNVFDLLKVRASYGQIGSEAINSYGTASVLANYGYYYGTSLLYPGYAPFGSPNADLKWEKSTTSNFGIDASFYKRRLNITLEYYYKKTTDLLQYISLPLYSGGGVKPQNIGSIENRGLEFSVNAVLINKKNFEWDATFNFWTGKNKVLSLGNITSYFPSDITTPSQQPNQFIVKQGQPLGTFWGYKSLGIWKGKDAAEAALYGAQPGDYKFEDLNGDNVINGDDLQVTGYSTPTTRWGFNSNLRYKAFNLNVFIEGVSGAVSLNYPIQQSANVSSNTQVPTIAQGLDYWKPENENTRFNNPLKPTPSLSAYSSQWLQNSNFIKLRNLSLSYDLPKLFAGATNVSLYISAQNIFTITKFYGADPENSFTGRSDTYGGYNAGSYPSARVITLGIKMAL
jgi:TonB-dependent starch-binding outer membrane protein SusC